MDESGFADFPDARPQVLVVPENYRHQRVPIPSDRRVKRSTMVTGIAADGTCWKPLVLVPRLTIEKELFFWGYDSENVRFQRQENGLVPIRIFEDWVTNILFLIVNANSLKPATADMVYSSLMAARVTQFKRFLVIFENFRLHCQFSLPLPRTKHNPWTWGSSGTLNDSHWC
jgi:hypothetical protein